MQLSILGKGGKVRQVLLPEIVSRSLLSLRGDAGANDPVFASRKGGGRLTERGVHAMVKRAARRPASMLTYRCTGCGTPTARTQSTVAPACRKSRQRSATATSQRHQGICMRAPTAPAGSSSIRECFFDEDESE
jgi:hypothetical protein